MQIGELGYVVVGATSVHDWKDFGTNVLGAMVLDAPGGNLYLKLDERAFRILVVPAAHDGLVASGWCMTSEQDFDVAVAALQAGGVDLLDSSPAERQLRRVMHMVSFVDPAGNTHELFCGPIVDSTQFASPLGVRFVTGDLGLGHVVLPANDKFDELVEFWTAHGFSRANSRTFPSGGRLRFLTCNGRQHSLALGELPAPAGCIHIAVEVATLDEVGRAADRAIAADRLVRTMGKHVNDSMVSIYVSTPGGFQLEYGFSDGEPEWRTELYFEDALGSYWGHTWLTEHP